MNCGQQQIDPWKAAPLAILAATWLACGGCSRAIPPGALVLCQTPQANTAMSKPGDALDARYPAGSRVVLSAPPFNQVIRVLSEGLFAAGAPAVSYDGTRVVFVGKAAPASEWQIYEVGLHSGRPHQVTAQPGGAMEPAFLPHGNIVFVSPVPRAGTSSPPPALYANSPEGKPLRLTFTTRPVRAPTLLSDGRILFVSEEASVSNSPPRCMLYTVNNDGTELTAFAAPVQGAISIDRPRQLADNRVAFITRTDERSGGTAGSVRLARPFQGCEPLLPRLDVRLSSVQPAGDGGLLLCVASSTATGQGWALFRAKAGADSPGEAIVAQAGWNTLEAMEASPSPRPMGRLSTMDTTKKTGQILCLNANFTRYSPEQQTGAPAARIRVLTATGGMERLLGEIPLQADGSFLAEVPADVPLGFEAVDATGSVLRRVPPLVWVRPGENRSCTGCHPPPHRSPQNQRPLAVNVPTPSLGAGAHGIAKK